MQTIKKFKNNILAKLIVIALTLFLAINPLLFPVLIYAEGDQIETYQAENQAQAAPSGIEPNSDAQSSNPNPPADSTPTTDSSSASVPAESPTTMNENQPTPTTSPDLTSVTSVDNNEIESNSETSETRLVIATGDAVADSEVEVNVNVNQATLPGEITTSPDNCTPPEGEVSCPTPIEINNDNVAENQEEATSSASTGQNSINQTPGDAAITTGDATAGGIITSEINSNTVVLEPTPSLLQESDPTVSEEATPSADPENSSVDPTFTPAPTQTLEIENNNQLVAGSSAEISASTGENQALENAGSATIETGDALAYGNIFNLLNTNVVGTNFMIVVWNLVDQNGDIDLNKIWKDLLAKEGEVLNLPQSSHDFQILVLNQNEATLENELKVEAFSGKNQASGNNGEVKIITGNAKALANVVNLVNTNLLGSTFFFGIINIFDSFNGNLILPRPENFANSDPATGESSNATFINQNEAQIGGGVNASASSGENQALDNISGSQMVTGDAQAVAQSFSLANLNIQRNNWFFLSINNLGSWLGSLLGWFSPSSAETVITPMSTYTLGLNSINENNGDNGQLQITNDNGVKVTNNIWATAQTGQNQADGNYYAQIETGKARALANLFNLANLNILGGRWFWGLTNILGDWQGNAVFAYPDMTISISDGQEEVLTGEYSEYTVSFQNNGYDEATGVMVRLNLPGGVSYVSDTSGISPQASGGTYNWNIGTVPAGAGGSFKVTTKINGDYTIQTDASILFKIFPKAYAAGEEFRGKLVVNASVNTSDPESNSSNNSASDVNEVFMSKSDLRENYVEKTDDPGEPKLEITAQNNVGEFVYPGDTVTFELVIENSGSGPADNSLVSQEMFDNNGESLGVANFDLGTIAPREKIRIDFGLTLAADLSSTFYTTVAKVIGTTPRGKSIESNEAKTEFRVLIDKFFPGPKVLAAETSGEGLYAANAQDPQSQPTCQLASVKEEKDWLPYILVTILGALWFTDWLRRKNQEGKLIFWKNFRRKTSFFA